MGLSSCWRLWLGTMIIVSNVIYVIILLQHQSGLEAHTLRLEALGYHRRTRIVNGLQHNNANQIMMHAFTTYYFLSILGAEFWSPPPETFHFRNWLPPYSGRARRSFSLSSTPSSNIFQHVLPCVTQYTRSISGTSLPISALPRRS